MGHNTHDYAVDMWKEQSDNLSQQWHFLVPVNIFSRGIRNQLIESYSEKNGLSYWLWCLDVWQFKAILIFSAPLLGTWVSVSHEEGSSMSHK